jgi:hypothetical protein
MNTFITSSYYHIIYGYFKFKGIIIANGKRDKGTPSIMGCLTIHFADTVFVIAYFTQIYEK